MGYAVLHIEKGVRADNTMSSHIERDHHPSNADETRKHLNKELIDFPAEVSNRTEAIRHRIKTSGIKRQVGKNQVQALRLIFSTSPEDMERIRQEGKLDEWCKDSIDWAKKEFGEKNVVSAVLHDDEKTPHIHVTVVPIVTGERRKVKNKQLKEDPTKRKYRKKDVNAPRLCADDVITKAKLIHYQDSYAEAMVKYGLERGVRGSEARHMSTPQYYRDLALKNKELEKSIELKESLRIQAEQNLNQVKGQLKTEELKNKVADVGSNIMDGIGSMIGTSKVKKQQQEIETLKSDKELLIKEVHHLKQNIDTMQKEHNSIMDKLKQELKKIYDVFPKIKELLRIENLCKHIGFSEELTKMILQMKPVGFKGKLYSPEYRQHFKTDHSEAFIKEHPTDKDKLKFTIDGVSETIWFRQKYKEDQPTINIKQNMRSKSRGL